MVLKVLVTLSNWAGYGVGGFHGYGAVAPWAPGPLAPYAPSAPCSPAALACSGADQISPNSIQHANVIPVGPD